MDCVNLLAFFQIAIAFDIGLLIFSDSHIFSKINRSLKEELNERNKKKVEEAKDLCQKLSSKIEESKTNRTKLRSNRALITEKLDEYQVYNSQEINWTKYSYIGLYAAFYGLLSLFVIGLFDCKFDVLLKNYLLLTGFLTFFFEILHLIWLRKVEKSFLSYYKLYVGLGWYLCINILLGILLGVFGNSSFILPFNPIYVPLAVMIIYFPILVFIFRIINRIWITNRLVKICLERVSEVKSRNLFDCLD